MENDVVEDLEGLIGKEAAEILVDHYAGSNFYIPKRTQLRKKYLTIKKEYRNGATYGELARQYGYTERYVRSIIHGRKARP